MQTQLIKKIKKDLLFDMIPYLILIFFPFIFLFISISKDRGKRTTILFGVDIKIQNANLLIPVFFSVFFLLLVLRHESVGVDVKPYKGTF